jgi:hypothetical protein
MNHVLKSVDRCSASVTNKEGFWSPASGVEVAARRQADDGQIVHLRRAERAARAVAAARGGHVRARAQVRRLPRRARAHGGLGLRECGEGLGEGAGIRVAAVRRDVEGVRIDGDCGVLARGVSLRECVRKGGVLLRAQVASERGECEQDLLVAWVSRLAFCHSCARISRGQTVDAPQWRHSHAP